MDHTKMLWAEINFTPVGFELRDDDDFLDSLPFGKEQMISTAEHFPPEKKTSP